MDIKQPNTHECLHYGRKLSNIACDNIEVDLGYIVIGSESDDEIYFGDCLRKGEKMLKERVKITAFYESVKHNAGILNIDLEDLLVFAAKYCKGIYSRVLQNRSKL